MTDDNADKVGQMTSLYCYDCEEERTFVWTKWSGVEFYGYDPEQEWGWECTACGCKLREPLNE